MKPWRERLRRAGLSGLTGNAAAVYDRQDAAMLAAIEVFGNDDDAGRWIYKQSHDFGDWIAPDTLVTESDEGLRWVLERLAELKPITTPKAGSLPWRGKARSAKRKR